MQVVAGARSGLTTFVAIDGPGGAGKRVIAARLGRALPRGAVVAVDDLSGRVAEWDWAVQRDGEAMLTVWLDVWIRSEQAYIAAHAPQRRVDLVVSGVEPP